MNERKPQRIRKPLFQGFRRKPDKQGMKTSDKKSSGNGYSWRNRNTFSEVLAHKLRGARLVAYYAKHSDKHPTRRARITMNDYITSKPL